MIAATLALPARADMTLPAWSPGDYWAYSGTSTSMGNPASGTLRLDVTGTESTTVQGVPYLSYRLQTDSRLVMPGAPNPVYMNMSGPMWYRTSDLALVKQDLSGTYEMPGVGSFPVSSYTEYDPPQSIQWPLTLGATWNAAGDMNIRFVFMGVPTDTNTSLRQTFSVESERMTTVPAGSFLTTPLRATTNDGYANVTYWSPVVGNGVLLTVNLGATEQSRMELTAYSHQGVVDTEPPTITNVAATPPVQTAGGSVTISATVEDNVAVSGVWVDVTQPDTTHVNRSMTGSVTHEYAYAQAWAQVGVHNFVIWASDPSGNWASATGSFRIAGPDTAPPTITNVAATPSPQFAGGTVTISADVHDDTAVSEVRANVTQPDGGHVNQTMAHGAGDAYSYAAAWSQLGVHDFVIWAADSLGHWASATGSFVIRGPDTEPPTITHAPPAPVYTGDAIRINATVADDDRVAEVRLVYTPVGGTEQNVTMTLSGSVYTYEIPGQSSAGTVRYRIYAVDPSGNARLSPEYTVAVRARSSAAFDLGLLAIILVILVVVVALFVLVAMRRRRKKPEEPPGATP